MTKNERNIKEIINEVWNNEAEDKDDQIEIYVSYITAYGHTVQEVLDFAQKYGVICDRELSDAEDEYDLGYGSLVINIDTIKDINRG